MDGDHSEFRIPNSEFRTPNSEFVLVTVPCFFPKVCFAELRNQLAQGLDLLPLSLADLIGQFFLVRVTVLP